LGLSEDHAEIVKFIDKTIASIETSIHQKQRSIKDMSTTGKRLTARQRATTRALKK